MYLLTLIYADESTFFVGGFETMDELNAWLAKEQAMPYWDEETTWDIDE